MRVHPAAFLVIMLVFGFLSASTVYFYNRSQGSSTEKKTDSPATFDAELPEKKNDQPDPVDSLTTPATPGNKLSYPANTYKIQPKESLFGIGEKLGVSWLIIKAANGIKNENLIQADLVLVIPKLSRETDYYRVNFLINEEKASELNRELRNEEKSDWFDPIAVSKKTAVPYFNVSADDQMRLVEADYSKGTALVEAKADKKVNYIGLIQPKTKGQKGLWALYYVENRDE